MRIRNVETGKLWNFNEIATDNRVLSILEENEDELLDVSVTPAGQLILLCESGKWYEFPYGDYYMET